MDAAEAYALHEFAPDLCELSQYWAQQAVGLCLELPCRLFYHSLCTAGTFVCCVSAPSPVACDPDRRIWRHHAFTTQLYYALPRLMLANLCLRPLAPWYVYDAEVGLVRPPKPPAPPDPCCDCTGGHGGDGDQFGCDCDCDCCCERLLYLVNRKLRSLMAVYSGVHACHPSTCCGPCPCVVWTKGDGPFALLDAPVFDKGSVRTGDGRCGTCILESAAARYARWDVEYSSARRRRTEAFYAQRELVPHGVPVGASEADGGEPRVYSRLLSGSASLLAYLWPERSPVDDAKGGARPQGHDASAHEEETTPYVELGEPASPPPPVGDSHRCEKVQGRLCSLALVSCCCTSVACVLHGGSPAALGVSYFQLPLSP